MSETEQSEKVDTEALGAIADDSISIFRTSLFLIIVYLTILSLVFREAGTEIIIQTLNSPYTINGFVFWLGSITMSVITYRTARRTTLLNEYANLGRIEDQFIIMNHITATMVGLFISITSLIFGLLQGWSTAISGTQTEISIQQPLAVIAIAFVFVLTISTLLSLVDKFRERYGSIREILHIS